MSVTSASLQRSVTEDEVDELRCQTSDMPFVGIFTGYFQWISVQNSPNTKRLILIQAGV